MIEEIKDRFGPPPEPVANLLKVMEVRLVMKRKGIFRLDVKENALLFTFYMKEKIDPQKVVDMIEKKRSRYSLLSDSRLKVNLRRTDPLSALLESKKVLEKFDFI
jgi:transcription-repair coupling factor (superfamily II helicase)